MNRKDYEDKKINLIVNAIMKIDNGIGSVLNYDLQELKNKYNQNKEQKKLHRENKKLEERQKRAFQTFVDSCGYGSDKSTR
jgi:hypothetical protein